MADTSKKDTIYVDIDDEITTVIEKVRTSNERIVALVLPKRASVLQSIVNMKLLKRSAEQAKKHVVLITSEVGLLPLAAAVGLYVAKNLQTKPEIPTNDADAAEVLDTVDADESSIDFNAETASDTPVGELAAASGTPLAPTASNVNADAIETLELDDDDVDTASPIPVTAASGAAAAKSAAKPKKDRKLAIPSFSRFKIGIIIAVALLIVLIGGLYLANVVLPKATITISTDTSDINSSLTLNLDTSAKSLSIPKFIVPAQVQQSQKNGSQQVNTTGKKNIGTPSKGSVTLTNCSADGGEEDLPAGTGVSSAGQTYITQNTVRLLTSTFDSHGSCKATSVSSSSVNVVAQNPGNNTVSSGTNMTVAGFQGSVTAKANGDIDGGTDNIVQTVAQADIDSATQKITAQNGDSVKQDLVSKLKQLNLFPVQATFAAGTPAVTKSANVGDQASSVTVTQSTTYTMFGVKEADLNKLVDSDVKDKIDAGKQSILSEGISKAAFRLNNSTATTAQLAMSTVATAGPDLNTSTIKQQVAGKKSGDIKSLLKNDPGVTDVNVHFSPFWVNKAPSKASKLTITFVKATP